jgi:outer membrane usher protein FimD/PapC
MVITTPTLRISEDVRAMDQYTIWASQYWPQGYIEFSMTIYDEKKPKLDTEDSKTYQRRRYCALRNLNKRYGKCGFTCRHQDCEEKRRRSYQFYLSSQKQLS